MGIPLRVLIVEDSEDDTLLLLRMLKNAGFDPVHQRMETADAMHAALAAEPWDIILSDFKMPHFSGIAALQLFKESGLDIPFIIVSGTIGEELAVEAMKAGANDYVMKENLSRLVPAIARELKEASIRQEKKRTENDLSVSENKYKLLVENANEAIIVVQNRAIKFANSKMEEITGYSKEELMTGLFTQFLHPDDCEMVMERHLSRLNGKEVPHIYSLRIITKSGQVRWLEINAVLFTWEGSTATLNFLSDITERKQAEEAMKESEEKYRLSFENVSDVICSIDRDFRFVTISPSVEKILDYKPVEIIGRSVESLTDIIAPESIEEVLSDTIKVLNGGSIRDAVYTVIAKDGTRKIGEISASPIIHDGTIVGVIAIARDITERRSAEEALENSLVNLRKTLGATIQAMAMAVETKDPYTAGHQRRVADLARTIATEMGLKPEQIDGVTLAGMVHDLGKIAVPSEILSKPITLSKFEMQLVRTHAQAGYDILKDMEFPWPIARMILEHHERMDGSGYPRGITGEDILLESRILTVADVVEAIASHRPSRPSLGIDVALDEIAKNKGILYDPDVVDACLKLFRENKYELVFDLK